MNKTNLEAFKMSKAQMNNVNGGKTRCVSYDRDADKMMHYEFDDREVADAREEVIALESGKRVNVACWGE